MHRRHLLPQASSMYMLIAPEQGGETLFASTAAAFEKLSPEDRELLLQLDTVNVLGTEVPASA